MDLQFADAILIMGSNMAECHPVAFRWVVQAKLMRALGVVAIENQARI